MKKILLMMTHIGSCFAAEFSRHQQAQPPVPQQAVLAMMMTQAVLGRNNPDLKIEKPEKKYFYDSRKKKIKNNIPRNQKFPKKKQKTSR